MANKKAPAKRLTAALLTPMAKMLPAAAPTSPPVPPFGSGAASPGAGPRANAQHAKLTEELRALKAEWAKRNIQAGQTRTAISTPEITHVETRRRELHLELEKTQAEVGRLNKLIAGAQGGRQTGTPVKGHPVPKRWALEAPAGAFYRGKVKSSGYRLRAAPERDSDIEKRGVS